MRAPPFPLSGGLLLPQGAEVRAGVPPSGSPPRPRLPRLQLRREGKASALLPRCGSSGAAGAWPGSPGRPPGCAAGRGSLPFPVSRRVPCGRGAAPAGPRGGRAGRVFVCGGWRCWTPRARHPRKAEGEPRRPQPHAPPGAATGPRAPAAAASPAPAPQCVVEGLGAGRLAACYRPGEAVTWHGGRA